MSNARYIEIDSTYRNRKQWPSPAEFEVLIAQSGRKNKTNAQDPVSHSARLNNFYWDSHSFTKASPPTHVAGPTINLTGSMPLIPGIICAGDNKTIIQVKASPNTLQQQENYYTGAVLTDGTDSARISSYVFLGTDFLDSNKDRAQITVQGSIKITSYNTLTINDPSDIIDPKNSFIFIPDGRSGLNSYVNHILYNESTNNYANILNYDPVTKLFKVSDISGKNWDLNANQRFSIRKHIPIFGNFSSNILPGEQSNLVFSLPLTFTDEPNVYQNSFLFIDNQTRLITRYETLTGKAVNGSVNFVDFPEGASNVNGYYNGAYIQITSGNANNDVRQIINYTVSGNDPNFVRRATVATPFVGSVIQGDSFTFRSIFVDSEFSVYDSNFEILLFSHDNHNPFVYTGSLQQEIVCYHIQLLNVILPNKILNCALGSRIAYYPYVYIEITNISGSSAGMKNVIYSNNPNATRMVFRAPIYDVQNPNNSSFVNLDGDGMIQTLKFKPNDNLFFSVHLSNGELYETLEKENYSPLHPNPEIQISASFSFKRVEN
jgi:hypothetical protein